MKHYSKRKTVGALLGAGMLALTHGAAAHGDKTPKKEGAVPKTQKDWGIAGDAKDARRRIDCRLLDTMRFSPERIDVKLGETVRFSVHNAGKVMHEFVIGTRQENAAHYALMKKHPNMEHDEPYMAHVSPGGRGEIVWKFNRPGEFEFACLVAGHYEAGMRGAIHVS